jgi:ribonuclease HII
MLSKYNKIIMSESEKIFIGVDEAGRGPLFGPVYTSAVVLPADENVFDKSILKDSKKFTSNKKINKVADYIIEKSEYYSTNFCNNEEVDKYNILQATQKSMHNSIYSVIEQIINNRKNNGRDLNNVHLLKSIVILVDGNYFKPFTYLYNDVLYPIKYKCIVKGDILHKEISAASILAKVSRDKYINDFILEHPDYQEKYELLNNKGYGTKRHIEGIKKYGYSPYHRKSFKLKKL